MLLFLHGGPGVTNRHGVLARHSDLCDDFTIVCWDQRGTGGSYWGVKDESLNLNQLIEDGAELIEYLCKSLGKEKIFIQGGSWGTELGTYLCIRHPEHIAGYIGSGQVVDGVLNEELSYDFAYTKAKEAGNEEDIKSKEYTLFDKIGVANGYKRCLTLMWPTTCKCNFMAENTNFPMPYYIFQGRHDNNTPSALVQDYFDKVQAPDKELVWFENSARGPMGEEPELYKKLLREKFLKIGENM